MESSHLRSLRRRRASRAPRSGRACCGRAAWWCWLTHASWGTGRPGIPPSGRLATSTSLTTGATIRPCLHRQNSTLNPGCTSLNPGCTFMNPGCTIMPACFVLLEFGKGVGNMCTLTDSACIACLDSALLVATPLPPLAPNRLLHCSSTHPCIQSPSLFTTISSLINNAILT
jgi:hypothetical protein